MNGNVRKAGKFLTFLGVTVQRMLMMLLDFSCPSCGYFFRNKRLLLRKQETLVRHVWGCGIRKDGRDPK